MSAYTDLATSQSGLTLFMGGVGHSPPPPGWAVPYRLCFRRTICFRIWRRLGSACIRRHRLGETTPRYLLSWRRTRTRPFGGEPGRNVKRGLLGLHRRTLHRDSNGSRNTQTRDAGASGSALLGLGDFICGGVGRRRDDRQLISRPTRSAPTATSVGRNPRCGRHPHLAHKAGSSARRNAQRLLGNADDPAAEKR